MKWLTLRKLRSTDFDTRSRAFAEATRNRDVDALLEVIGDADEWLRSDAIKALGAIGDPRAVPALIKALDDSNFTNQERAAAALAGIGDRRAGQPLAALLRAPRSHPQARGVAAKALVTLGDAKVIPTLLEALRDADQLSRYLSLEVLAVIGDGRCVPSAVAALRDPDGNVRWRAVEALGALGDTRAVEPLLDLLSRGAPGDTPDRAVIAAALGRLGDRRAAAALAGLLDEPDRRLRDAAAAALDACGWQPSNDAARVPYYLACERWDELTRLGWTGAGPTLSALLRQTTDTAIRLQAIKALGLIGGPFVVAPLIAALVDSDEDVATKAADALAAVGDARALVPVLEHCLRYRPTGGYRNNPSAPAYEQSRADQWLAPLETLARRSAAAMTLEDLQRLIALNDTTHRLSVEYDTPGYGDGADDFSVVVAFGRIRHLATTELGRRGMAV
jgi:HEAT repeat protein